MQMAADDALMFAQAERADAIDAANELRGETSVTSGFTNAKLMQEKRHKLRGLTGSIHAGGKTNSELPTKREPTTTRALESCF